jgi:hypothetical protein
VTGAGKRLKRWDPSIKVYAAEPEYGDLVYGLRNLDEGYVPEVLDQSVLDSRIKVDSLKALRWTRRLAEEEGIFAGVSTGEPRGRRAGVRPAARGVEGRRAVARRWLEVPLHRCVRARRRRGDRRPHQRDPLGLTGPGPQPADAACRR